LVESVVKELLTPEESGFFKLIIGDIELKVTREHPILTPHGWKKASDLELDEEIITIKDSRENIEKLMSKEFIQETVTVYNLKVSEPNTFIANSVVVHNKGGGGGSELYRRIFAMYYKRIREAIM